MLYSHVSDTHGFFPDLPKEAEIIIHSGDLCPNMTRGHRETEVKFQSEWVKRNALTFKDWIGDRPFLFCMGNHDFTPYVCRTLREVGIDAIDITSTKIERDGIKYYGFPFIPYIDGEWNGECFVDQMQREVRRLKDELESGIDILVAHAPIAGILDSFNGNHYGNCQMADMFNYRLDRKFWPKAYLCGHIHLNDLDQKNRMSELDGMIISNAATKVNFLEIK